MALTQVRAKFGNAWTVLTYNSATGRYEGSITPTATSSGQTGGYYSITIEAKNATGQTATVSGEQWQSLRLVVQDTVAPVLTVTSPANNLVTAAESVTVSGTATDSVGLSSVKVNGSAVTVAANGSFSKSVSLSGGQNTITVVAEDTSGNKTTVTRKVTRATNGPTLTITSPAAGALIRASTVTVTGAVSDSVSPVKSVTVNGVNATISNGTYSATVSLTEGSNTLTVVAKNNVDLSTTATRSVTRDTTAPTLNVTAPANNLITAAASVTVSGTVSDAVAVNKVTVNGTSVSVSSGGAWSGTVNLSAGNNTITVVATDTAGNSATVTRTVKRETQGPNLTITSPAAGYLTKNSTVAVTGTVSANISPVKGVTVNGVAATISGSTYTATVSLSEGSNTITVTGSNQVNLTTTKTVSVTRDSTAPTIALTSPTTGQMVSNATFTVTGTVSDDRSGVSGVTVNGGAATVSGGTFSRTITLSEGANIITAVASDAAGNTATATGSVLLDTIPPSLTVAYPAGSLITNQPQITVTGTSSDGGSGLASVTVNGTAVTVSGGAYSRTLTLAEGQNTITVIATDRVGHTTTLTRSVLLDTAPPVLALVSPPAGFLDTSTPTVVFSVVDEPGGSGVDLNTVAVYVDNVPHAATVADGTITITPTLADGAHIITTTVEDVAGNQRGLSASYTVDTVPPELTFSRPTRHVVDWESIEVSGTVFDATSGVASVTVNGTAVAVTGGRFFKSVPLNVGENTITVAVADNAGLSTAKTLWVLRLITDRTQADVDKVTALLVKPLEDFTAAEKSYWMGIVRGAYNAEDMNRVGTAVEYLTDELQKRGYDPQTAPKTDWTVSDAPVKSQTGTYLENVKQIRQQLPVQAPPVPEDMEGFTFLDANTVEINLVESERMYLLSDLSTIYAGEGFSGEF